jgi:hypothetical protein
MNRPADRMRSAARVFAQVVADEGWRDGLRGASVAYAVAVLYLAIVGWASRGDG